MKLSVGAEVEAMVIVSVTAASNQYYYKSRENPSCGIIRQLSPDYFCVIISLDQVYHRPVIESMILQISTVHYCNILGQTRTPRTTLGCL